MLIRNKLHNREGYFIKYVLIVAAKILYLPLDAESAMENTCGSRTGL
jgi:hypothetical protein